MEILAVNKSKSESKFFKILEFVSGFVYIFVLAIGLILLTVKVFFLDSGSIGLGYWLLAVGLFLGYMSIFVLDNYIRLYNSVETISIQGDNLVIECTNSILRRRKTIPLSTIQNVKMYCGSTSKITIPDTLRVIYGRKHRYRFGIYMSDEQRRLLAKRILDFANQAIVNKD